MCALAACSGVHDLMYFVNEFYGSVSASDIQLKAVLAMNRVPSISFPTQDLRDFFEQRGGFDEKAYDDVRPLKEAIQTNIDKGHLSLLQLGCWLKNIRGFYGHIVGVLPVERDDRKTMVCGDLAPFGLTKDHFGLVDLDNLVEHARESVVFLSQQKRKEDGWMIIDRRPELGSGPVLHTLPGIGLFPGYNRTDYFRHLNLEPGWYHSASHVSSGGDCEKATKHMFFFDM
jgi:hypothetical protein